jgi:hypothetical protein
MVTFTGRDGGNGHNWRDLTPCERRLEAVNAYIVGLFEQVAKLLNERSLSAMAHIIHDPHGREDPRLFVTLADRPALTYELQGHRFGARGACITMTGHELVTSVLTKSGFPNSLEGVRHAKFADSPWFATTEPQHYNAEDIVRFITSRSPQRKPA